MDVDLDPTRFEPAGSSFVDAQFMLRLRPGTGRSGWIDLHGKTEASLRCHDLPAGISVTEPHFLSKDQWGAHYGLEVSVASSVKPGRYFIPHRRHSGERKTRGHLTCCGCHTVARLFGLPHRATSRQEVDLAQRTGVVIRERSGFPGRFLILWD